MVFMSVVIWVMRLTLFSVLLVFLLPLQLSLAQEEIPMLTYHDAPPFIIDEKEEQGLTYDLAHWLTKRSDGRYRFSVKTVPRKRLDAMLGMPRAAVVPWANPKWFEKVWMQNQYWTRPVLNDGNALISLSGKPFEYSGPQSLIGKTVVGLRGGQWVGLDELVGEGKIRRLDAQSYLQAINIVLAGRADVAVMPDPVARFYAERGGLFAYLHFSERPHSNYTRHFLVTENRDFFAFLDSQIPHLQNDPDWRAAVRRYGMGSPYLTTSH